MGKKYNNKKGITLAIVIMIMLVLSLIGATFIGISGNQSRQATIVDKGMNAHYLARAGAEAALSAWQKAPSTSKPSGTLDTLYLNNANVFTDSNTDEKGHFVASYTINPSDSNQTIIHSIGTVGSVTKDVSILINKTLESIVNPRNFANGDETGFFDFNSGQLNPNNQAWPHNNGDGYYTDTKGNAKRNIGIVLNKAKNGKGLKLPSRNSDTAAQEFEMMFFESTFQVLHNQVTLKSNIIYFTQGIDFNTSSPGTLVLKIYGDRNGAITEKPVELGGVSWGVIVLTVDGSERGFYFKNLTDGVVLSSDEDIEDELDAGNLVEIVDQDILDRFKNLFGTTITVTSYSILWTD